MIFLFKTSKFTNTLCKGITLTAHPLRDKSIKLRNDPRTPLCRFPCQKGDLHMKRTLLIIALIFGIIGFTALGALSVFARECEDVRSEVLRLHIPANSDSEEDQSVKLEVRDMLLREFGNEFNGCGDLAIAEEKAAELLPEIERRCTEYLHERGFDYDATAELVTMYFTTREYDRLILPAGEYSALRITLGSGEGHNWWCVIFPQLCLPAVSENVPENAENVLDSFGKPQKVTVKFAVVEFFERFFH